MRSSPSKWPLGEAQLASRAAKATPPAPKRPREALSVKAPPPQPSPAPELHSITQHIHLHVHDATQSLPIAVAVPMGPSLPLAIASSAFLPPARPKWKHGPSSKSLALLAPTAPLLHAVTASDADLHVAPPLPTRPRARSCNPASCLDELRAIMRTNAAAARKRPPTPPAASLAADRASCCTAVTATGGALFLIQKALFLSQYTYSDVF